MSEHSEERQEETGSNSPIIPLPAELPRGAEEVTVNSAPSSEPEKLEKALLAVITRSFSYSRRGPLPHPQELAEYEKVIPGSAERILAASERQALHRIGLEQQMITAQNHQSGRGQVFGFIIALVCLVLAFAAIMTGHEVSGALIGSIDLVALVTVFVLGKTAQKAELREKAQGVPPPSVQ